MVLGSTVEWAVRVDYSLAILVTTRTMDSSDLRQSGTAYVFSNEYFVAWLLTWRALDCESASKICVAAGGPDDEVL